MNKEFLPIATRLQDPSENPLFFSSRSVTVPINRTVAMLKDIAQASKGIQEVNENVNQSSRAAADITQDIAVVNESAGNIASGSDLVTLSVESLKRMATELNTIVGSFKI
jgi:methyl-accepting chemotaxis protein